MSNILNTIAQLTLEVNQLQEALAAKSAELNKAVEFPYKLRQLVEGNLRKGLSQEYTVNEVLARLKEVTPHGPDNKIDP